MTTNGTAITAFISYAHEDEALLRQLHTHLSSLTRPGLISTWYDRQIVAGTDWAGEIDAHLEQASLILLLVSADFLASRYCYEVEMKRALERHEAGQARVIPIALRSTDWKGMPFARLQALPTDARAVTSWGNQDEAWTNVVAGIRRAIEDLALLPASTTRAALPRIWNIPYARNSFFLGRDELLVRPAHAGAHGPAHRPLSIATCHQRPGRHRQDAARHRVGLSFPPGLPGRPVGAC